jgi:hypothetical protein
MLKKIISGLVQGACVATACGSLGGVVLGLTGAGIDEIFPFCASWAGAAVGLLSLAAALDIAVHD